MFDRWTVPVIIPRWRVQDIDEPDDWVRAELMFQSLEGHRRRERPDRLPDRAGGVLGRRVRQRVHRPQRQRRRLLAVQSQLLRAWRSTAAGAIGSCLELGANVGMNLKALRLLYPEAAVKGVEINPDAARLLAETIGAENVRNESIFDYLPAEQFDLVLVKGVLIHINPEMLATAYDRIYQSARRWILIGEYYNPSPGRRALSRPRRPSVQARLRRRDARSPSRPEAGRLRIRLPPRPRVPAGRHHLVPAREESADDADLLPALRDAEHQAGPGARRRGRVQRLPRLRGSERGRLGRAARRRWWRCSTAIAQDGRNWDCIVPVSGGKDSTYQVIAHAAARAEPAVRHRDDLRPVGDRPPEHREHQAPRRRLRRVLAQPGGPRQAEPDRPDARSATSPGRSTSASSPSRCARRCSSTCR